MAFGHIGGRACGGYSATILAHVGRCIGVYVACLVLGAASVDFAARPNPSDWSSSANDGAGYDVCLIDGWSFGRDVVRGLVWGIALCTKAEGA